MTDSTGSGVEGPDIDLDVLEIVENYSDNAFSSYPVRGEWFAETVVEEFLRVLYSASVVCLQNSEGEVATRPLSDAYGTERGIRHTRPTPRYVDSVELAERPVAIGGSSIPVAAEAIVQRLDLDKFASH